MSAVAPRRIPSWWWIPAAAALVAIWSWQPAAPIPVPANHAEPVDAQALASLAPDTPFLIRGTLQMTEDAAGQPWQGRDVYLHRAQRDLGGWGASRHIVVQTIEQQRPALLLHWDGGSIAVAANSYRLDFSPRIEPGRNGNWDHSSRGFRNGDQALALGRTGADGRYWIESLLASPLGAVYEDIRLAQRPRLVLVLAAKIMVSLFIVSLLIMPQAIRRKPVGNRR